MREIKDARLFSLSIAPEPNAFGEIIKEVRMETHDIGWAVAKLKMGYRVYRKGWNGKGQQLELQNRDEHSKMTLPYVYIMTVTGDLVPWLCSQTDLLAEDWDLV